MRDHPAIGGPEQRLRAADGDRGWTSGGCDGAHWPTCPGLTQRRPLARFRRGGLARAGGGNRLAHARPAPGGWDVPGANFNTTPATVCRREK